MNKLFFIFIFILSFFKAEEANATIDLYETKKMLTAYSLSFEDKDTFYGCKVSNSYNRGSESLIYYICYAEDRAYINEYHFEILFKNVNEEVLNVKLTSIYRPDLFIWPDSVLERIH